METRWLTYDELAAALRITADSARRLVARNKQWPRKPGNDGRVRIAVPAERIPPDDIPGAREDATPDAALDVSPDAVPDIAPDDTRTVIALDAHIATLKDIVAKGEAALERANERADQLERNLAEERARATLLQAEAAAAPALRQTVEALKGALDTERDRARDLRAERDRFLRDLEQQMTRRSWWPFRRAG